MTTLPNETTNRSLESAWILTPEEVVRALRVDPETGLEFRDVSERLRAHGPNALQEMKRTAWWQILLRQFKSLIVILLAVAAGVSLAFADWLEGAAIGLVILINAAIGLVTELRAVRSMEALQRLSRVRAKVRRLGQLAEIPAEGLVPGDIVILEAGDLIPADLRILTASKLQTDESALTGESLPVSKRGEARALDTPLAERTSMLFKGTTITRGSGVAVTVATGMNTELGKISSLLDSAEEQATPLERRLDRLGRMLLWAALAIAAVIAGIGIASGKEILLMVETSIALAVAAIPEGLPIVATLALARGMWRMAERNAVIRRLSAVETLGAASVICTDKTGTLTENRMAVSRFVLASGDVVADADAYRSADGRAASLDDGLLRAAIEVSVLCNNAGLAGADGVGDPLEIALIETADALGLDVAELRARHPEVREDAFDPDTQRMATLQEAPDGDLYVTAKGAPESILEACSHILTASGPVPLDDALRSQWMAAERDLAGEGLRVLGLASKRVTSREAPAYQDLVLIGWVALADPPRTDVREAIERCRGAGIEVVMVTGDQPATGRSIGAAVGLVDGERSRAVRGADLGNLEDQSEDELRRLLETPVFARVSPKQKLDLIALYQRDGRVVAMTGDGVNDAPALKKADIGVAMGLRGTQVAQEAADMVLKDDAFSTIVEAVAQGRAIFTNIRKFVVYLLSCNVSEILAVAIASFAGLPMPLLPLQILFLNLVTDVFPALALGAGEGDPNAMTRSPRPVGEPIVGRRQWRTIGLYGVLIAVVVLGALTGSIHALGFGESQGMTIAFLTLAFAQLWHVFNMRDPGSGFLRNDITRNCYIWGALGLCSALLLSAVYVPGLSTALRTADPGLRGWAVVLAASLVPWCVGQISLIRSSR